MSEPLLSDAEIAAFMRRLARQAAHEEYHSEIERLEAQDPTKHRTNGMAEPLHFTMEEVAAKLRVSRRWLQPFLKDHPHYRLAGAKKLFTAVDVQRLSEAMRCPSSSTRLGKGSRQTGRSGARTSGSQLSEALALVTNGAEMRAGVEFIPENGGGAGVRLRKRAE